MILFLLLLIVPLFAQTEDKPCHLDLKAIRLGVRHTEGEGIGYNKGYSTLDLVWIPVTFDPLILFTDLRGHRFTDGKFAGNGGIGVRYPHLPTGYAYGANIFYDYRRLKQSNLNRLGAGLEALGSFISFRANGYFPIGARNTRRTGSGKTFHNMPGVDGDIEIRAYSGLDHSLFVSGGPYYYIGDRTKNALGGQARLLLRVLGMFDLAAMASYDNLFHFNFQGRLGITFTFGPRKKVTQADKYKKGTLKCLRLNRLFDQLNRRVQRGEIPATVKQSG